MAENRACFTAKGAVEKFIALVLRFCADYGQVVGCLGCADQGNNSFRCLPPAANITYAPTITAPHLFFLIFIQLVKLDRSSFLTLCGIKDVMGQAERPGGRQ